MTAENKGISRPRIPARGLLREDGRRVHPQRRGIRGHVVSPCTDSHIVLVGMMGAGKSSVGRSLSRKLGRELFDSDEMVEARTGRTVREIWATDGESDFQSTSIGITSSPCAVAIRGKSPIIRPVNRISDPRGQPTVWSKRPKPLRTERQTKGSPASKHAAILDCDCDGRRGNTLAQSARNKPLKVMSILLRAHTIVS